MSFTLAILKPDAVANPIVLKFIRDAIYQNGLKITKACRLKLNREQASQLYSIHSSKFFYDRLIRHVCSGPVIVMQLTSSKNIEKSPGFFSKFLETVEPEKPCPLVIKRWRETLGPSKLFANAFKIEADCKDSNYMNIRQFFAVSDTRNVGHGSDSLEECQREYLIFKDLLKPVSNPSIDIFQLERLVNDEAMFF